MRPLEILTIISFTCLLNACQLNLKPQKKNEKLKLLKHCYLLNKNIKCLCLMSCDFLFYVTASWVSVTAVYEFFLGTSGRGSFLEMVMWPVILAMIATYRQQQQQQCASASTTTIVKFMRLSNMASLWKLTFWFPVNVVVFAVVLAVWLQGLEQHFVTLDL